MSVVFSLKEVQLFERPITLRIPFRYGIVTLREAPQAFARIRIENAQGKSAWGMSAQMMAPKWFDKNPNLTNEDNFQQLKRVTYLAKEAYLAHQTATAFGFFEANYQRHKEACAQENLNELVASFGLGLLDAAILDAICHLESINIQTALNQNIVGLKTSPLFADVQQDVEAMLKTIVFQPSIEARHTVGMLDAITPMDNPNPVDDGLPETLEAIIDTYGHTYFKVKISGQQQADIHRLTQITTVLNRLPKYALSLDGNEQFEDMATFETWWQSFEKNDSLARLRASILFIEQPIKRQNAFKDAVPKTISKPIIIDESDARLDSFLLAKDYGYCGISSKTCKGVYRSIFNYFRSKIWNQNKATYFLSGEDLTTQAGLAVQQDLALVSLLGITHVERNGHHYVDGFQGTSEEEALLFLQKHPHLYHRTKSGNVRLTIQQGKISLQDLQGIGFASNVHPTF